MKALNVKVLGSFIILATLVFSQYIFAGIIRDDDVTPTVTRTIQTRIVPIMVITPVNIDLVGSEIMVNFNMHVGEATVTIVGQSGNIIYQTIVDSNNTAEVAVPITNLESGEYTVTVVYGSTTLVEVVTI